MRILISNRQKKVKLNISSIRKTVADILSHLGVPEKEISIVFLDDEGIQKINRAYLCRNRPTNVISFPMKEGEFGDINPDLLGDVVISAERVYADSIRFGVSSGGEMKRILVHGILHLLGLDHERSRSDARRMESKEAEVLESLNKKRAR